MSRVRSALLRTRLQTLRRSTRSSSRSSPTNPFACVAYMTAGADHPPVEKTKEAYTAKIVYQDYRCQDRRQRARTSSTRCRRVQCRGGSDPRRCGRHGRTWGHAWLMTPSSEAFCRDPQVPRPERRIYMVNFTRDRVTLTSYSDDAIRTKVETWADTVAALA